MPASSARCYVPVSWHAHAGATPTAGGDGSDQSAGIGGLAASRYGAAFLAAGVALALAGPAPGNHAFPAVSRGRVFGVDLNGKLTAYALPAASR